MARLHPPSTVTVFGVALALAGMAAAPVHAQPYASPAPRPPSPFTYAFHGLVTGAGIGLAGGYLAYRGSDDARDFAYGAGIGALAGGALGLAIGIADVTAQLPGRASLVLRDTAYGTWFGAVAGGIVGGLVALSSDHDAEAILLGGAVGALGGAGLGIAVGFVEASGYSRSYRQATTWAPTLALAPAARQGVAIVPALAGRF